MWRNESEVRIWKAGEIAPAGTYVRIDTRSYHLITLEQEGPLPTSFDGQVALYRAAPRQARCLRIAPGTESFVVRPL